jgi:hypothetical protein
MQQSEGSLLMSESSIQVSDKSLLVSGRNILSADACLIKSGANIHFADRNLMKLKRDPEKNPFKNHLAAFFFKLYTTNLLVLWTTCSKN